MTDCVHLYVFDCQNFVSEKDYRAVLEQRRGFENAALDNETAAKKAKEQRDIMQQQVMDAQMALGAMAKAFNEDIGKAHEAGRREGHLDALQALVTGLGMDINVRALIDSPKAEGEEPDATR